MKPIINLGILLVALLLTSCSLGPSNAPKTHLPPTEFSNKINELPSAPLIDVRTPGEFSQGHLKNAININWNGDNFDAEINKLDKTKPVLIYCQSGGRSSSAANHMLSAGFKDVIELSGGISKWRAAGLPVTN